MYVNKCSNTFKNALFLGSLYYFVSIFLAIVFFWLLDPSTWQAIVAAVLIWALVAVCMFFGTYCWIIVFAYAFTSSKQLIIYQDHITFHRHKGESKTITREELDHVEVVNKWSPLKGIERQHLVVYVKGEKTPYLAKYVDDISVMRGYIVNIIKGVKFKI